MPDIQIECDYTYTPSSIETAGANGDESRFAGSYIGSYTKGLLHSPQAGEVDAESFQELVKRLTGGTAADFDQLPLSGPRPYTDPQAGLASDPIIPRPAAFLMRSAPAVDSNEAAAEMVELYWMALLRDIPFLDWEGGALSSLDRAVMDLCGLTAFTGPLQGDKVTRRTLFRGVERGCNIGPYVSQYLLQDIPYGALTISQRLRTVMPERDYVTRWEEYVAIQNGQLRWGTDAFDPVPRYIRSLRDLGQYVHIDELYEAHLNAALVLLRGKTPFDPGNPYTARDRSGNPLPNKPQAKTQMGFGTFGGPHLLTLVTEVATRALKTVWHQKWFIHRRLRPERYGALVERQAERHYPLPDQVLQSEAVGRVKQIHDSALLPLQFPEGSPLHPSYGAGHATVAGACVTLLKAWFDESTPIVNPIIASADGTSLVPYTGGDSDQMNVGGELNKLASNIAIARNAAGVHWRSDYYDSLRLGERIAVALLVNESGNFNEAFSLTFTSFDGRPVTITGGPDNTPGRAVNSDDNSSFLPD